jgi:hypothetical protein
MHPLVSVTDQCEVCTSCAFKSGQNGRSLQHTAYAFNRGALEVFKMEQPVTSDKADLVRLSKGQQTETVIQLRASGPALRYGMYSNGHAQVTPQVYGLYAKQPRPRVQAF